jgi:hypothetical protein
MNSKKLNFLIGFATLIIVYGTGILIFKVLSYSGGFFAEKDPNMVTLYTFLTGVAIVLYIALWIKTERKMIIMLNTTIAISLLVFTPALGNAYYQIVYR